MSLKEFLEVLSSTGIPVAYWSFPKGKAPAMPYICYFETDSNNFFADGTTYQKITGIAVELYTKEKDFEAEEKVEKALSSFCWNKEETHLDDENCYEVIYELEV